jgi:hypothetical protein
MSRHTLRARALVPALFSIAALASGAALATPATTVGVTAGIPGFAVSQVGTMYFKANFDLLVGSGPVILAGLQDGTGTTAVDDVVVITITRPDGTTTTWKHDYSNGCSGAIGELAPQDLTASFQPGVNHVAVVLKDKCGSVSGAQQMWIAQPIPQ